MFCKNCGTQLSNNAKFCGTCGRPVADRQRKPATGNNQQIPEKKPTNVGRIAVIGGAGLVFLCVGIVILGVILFAIPKILNGSEGGQSADVSSGLEKMTVKGDLVLPDGSALSSSELTVITLTDEKAVNDDGSFSLTSVHASNAPQLVMALNEQDNPVLMGIFGDSELNGYGLSVESTARAFVLYDMAVLSMPPDQRAVIARSLNFHPAFKELQDQIARAILSDPIDPLLGDNHPELYEQAAKITADLLDQAGWLSLSNNNSGISNVSIPQPNDDVRNFIDVEDDKDYGPQVILVNKTWAYYRVEASLDGQPWSIPGQSSIYLGRNNLYGTMSLEWPPVSYRSLYEPKIGDGQLSFTFNHDKEMTMLDLFMTTASTALGIGKSTASNKHIKLMLSLKSTFADGIRDIMQQLPQHQQMSFSEAVSTYTWTVGYNGGKLLLAVTEAMVKEEISNAVGSGLIKQSLKFVLKKMAAPISVAYGSADMAAIIYSYNNTPDTAVFSDEQRFGIYPAVKMAINPPSIEDGEAWSDISFTLNASRFPAELEVVNYTWDFGDGSEQVEGGADLAGQSFTDMRDHAFSTGDFVVKVTVYDIHTKIPIAQGIIPVTTSKEPLVSENEDGTSGDTATQLPPSNSQEFGWVLTGTRTNDWKSRLEANNAASVGWKYSVEASEGAVTIKSTYVGSREDSWMRNGMSESGTVTWSPPSKTLIRPDDVVSINLTAINAPRDHSNFYGIISITVKVWRLNEDGTRNGNPISYFSDGNGLEILGYVVSEGPATKELVKATVSEMFKGGSSEGQKMSIVVSAQGGGQIVETEYIYEWKRQ